MSSPHSISERLNDAASAFDSPLIRWQVGGGRKRESCPVCVGHLVLLVGLAIFPASTVHAEPNVVDASNLYIYEVWDGPSLARDINNKGEIVGSFQDGGLRDANGMYMSVEGVATGINDVGVIIGVEIIPTDVAGIVTTHAFKLENDVREIVNFPGAERTSVGGINNSGILVGGYGQLGMTTGFLLEQDNFRTITVPNARRNWLSDVNDSGTLVGTFSGQQLAYSRGFILDNAALEVIHVPGTDSTALNAINNLGHVAGSFTSSIFAGDQGGFVFADNTYFIVRAPGAVSTFIEGMNDEEQLAGYFLDTEGMSHGFIATPIPELPGSWLLLVAGVGSFACLRRRRNGKTTHRNRTARRASALEHQCRFNSGIGEPAGIAYTNQTRHVVAGQ